MIPTAAGVKRPVIITHFIFSLIMIKMNFSAEHNPMDVIQNTVVLFSIFSVCSLCNGNCWRQ